MACRFEITMPARETAGVRAARMALDEVDKIESRLTVFRDTSELSYLNRNAASRPVGVDNRLFALLSLCRDLHRDTEGAFDVTSGPLTRCWGFLAREGRIPSEDELEPARAVVGSDKLLFDEDSSSIGFAAPGMEVNLGSIGKGYALDRLVGLLRRQVGSALLSAGASSVRAIGSGDRGHSGWVVGIRHPRQTKTRLATLTIRDCAMSTSGSEEQSFTHDGTRYGHIIDPRSGMPADRISGVTVVAESAAISDALATAFFVGGPELADRYCRVHPETLVLMLESGVDKPLMFGSNAKCEVEIA
jgi:thiamine biosynthesis lipoprotein